MKRKAVSRTTASFFLNLLFPRRCASCGSSLEFDNEDFLCPACFSKIRWADGPACAVCGRPLFGMVHEPVVCSGCVADPPHYDRARSIFYLEETGRELILNYKYRSDTHLARPAARWMAQRGSKFYVWTEYDACLAVPLHYRKRRERGFNQSLLLARRFSRLASLPLRGGGLSRKRYTGTQTRLTLARRRKNVRGAFRLKNPKSFWCRRLLLIDDVYTSGSTVNECARMLKDAGALRVDVLTLARVRF